MKALSEWPLMWLATPSHWNVSHTLPVWIGTKKNSFAGQIRPKNVNENENLLAKSSCRKLEECVMLY